MLEPNRNLDLETLYTYLVVVERGSFSAAAALLYKTPSAVSYRIKNLEHLVGVKLLNRTTHSVEPTEAGLRLVDRAKFILDWHEDVYEELRLVEQGIEAVFTIVINNLLYDSLAVARLLGHLCARFPSTAFEVKRAVYMGVWDAMLHEKGHFAIGTPTFHSVGEDHRTRPLGLIEWQLVCAPEHPALRADGSIAPDDVRDIPAINIEDTSVVMAKRSPWRLRGQDEMIVPDMHTKIQCHIQGLGIGFLPRPVAQHHIQRGELVDVIVDGLSREDSPMSYARPKKRLGIIGDHLEELFTQEHPLIQPFLFPITKRAALDDDRS